MLSEESTKFYMMSETVLKKLFKYYTKNSRKSYVIKPFIYYLYC